MHAKIIMFCAQAAQPALLYIVPSILGCTAIHAMLQGELKQVFEHSEAVEETQPHIEAKPEGGGGEEEEDEAKKTK